jgi:hypothetical protein
MILGTIEERSLNVGELSQDYYQCRDIVEIDKNFGMEEDIGVDSYYKVGLKVVDHSKDQNIDLDESRGLRNRRLVVTNSF